ncbi:MAG TPA: 4-hydroxythreonine-4-phosphate dehydrogenase PdxA [Lautropia sp.]|jgi:4-hydroxythreonine-4-phosphate dehydrogenase|nr:4-hydroxythreonine-4-phosphate dehydrogenase PdxA [Lautropia sp.]
MTRLPTIGVLLGDPSGIGPELTVKLLADPASQEGANLLLIGDRSVLKHGEAIVGKTLELNPVDAIESATFVPGRVSFFEVKSLTDADIEPGRVTQASGRYAYGMLGRAAAAAIAGHLDGIVFAPLNKAAMRLGGLEHEDEQRYLQHVFGVGDFVCEFNVTGPLWTSRVTSHMPLREVADAITHDGVCNAVAIIDRSLKAAGILRPRIGVAALNPHAGDSGTIGREEIEVIAPAVETMKARGVEVRGPLPSDTVFVAARKGAFDAVVSMYHDQGQIAMKLIGFEGGVTVLGGLPVPITTCASGTAFDIVGKGIANVEGLKNALAINKRMAASGLQSAASAAPAALSGGARVAMEPGDVVPS